jgi:hypothetical protein
VQPLWLAIVALITWSLGRPSSASAGRSSAPIGRARRHLDHRRQSRPAGAGAQVQLAEDRPQVFGQEDRADVVISPAETWRRSGDAAALAAKEAWVSPSSTASPEIRVRNSSKPRYLTGVALGPGQDP